MIVEPFLQDLHGCLLHLYDPTYVPSAKLRLVTGCQAVNETDCIRAAIIRAIKSMRPVEVVPPSARLLRFYQILYQRFVMGHTQEETSEILSLTPRHLRREEHEAIAQLAHHLIDYGAVSHTEKPPATIADSSSTTDLHLKSISQDWRLQLTQELSSLHKTEHGHVTRVIDAVHNAEEICSPLSRQLGIEMVVDLPEVGLVTVISASVLRQALIMTLLVLFERAGGGKIAITAMQAGDSISVNLSCSLMTSGHTPNIEPIGSLLASQGGSIETISDGLQLTVRMILSAVHEINVLVVDDNEDIIYLYQRYVSGTIFHLDHSDASSLLTYIESNMPDIIILDVMMPEVDGWEVLKQLHEHPLTCTVPVIVCSIIKAEMLAQSLGATLYLPKPVTQDQFLAALNRVALLIEPQEKC